MKLTNLIFIISFITMGCSNEKKTESQVVIVNEPTSKDASKTNNDEEEVDPVIKLIRELGCFACHHQYDKIVGPAFIEISKKYDTTNKIEHSIINGSTGIWGQIAMPGNNTITPAEAKLIALYIIGLKEDQANE